MPTSSVAAVRIASNRSRGSALEKLTSSSTAAVVPKPSRASAPSRIARGVSAGITSVPGSAVGRGGELGWRDRSIPRAIAAASSSTAAGAIHQRSSQDHAEDHHDHDFTVQAVIPTLAAASSQARTPSPRRPVTARRKRLVRLVGRSVEVEPAVVVTQTDRRLTHCVTRRGVAGSVRHADTAADSRGRVGIEHDIRDVLVRPQPCSIGMAKPPFADDRVHDPPPELDLAPRAPAPPTARPGAAVGV